jgi:hypothetical protein
MSLEIFNKLGTCRSRVAHHWVRKTLVESEARVPQNITRGAAPKPHTNAGISIWGRAEGAYYNGFQFLGTRFGASLQP